MPSSPVPADSNDIVRFGPSLQSHLRSGVRDAVGFLRLINCLSHTVTRSILRYGKYAGLKRKSYAVSKIQTSCGVATSYAFAYTTFPGCRSVFDRGLVQRRECRAGNHEHRKTGQSAYANDIQSGTGSQGCAGEPGATGFRAAGYSLPDQAHTGTVLSSREAEGIIRGIGKPPRDTRSRFPICDSPAPFETRRLALRVARLVRVRVGKSRHCCVVR